MKLRVAFLLVSFLLGALVIWLNPQSSHSWLDGLLPLFAFTLSWLSNYVLITQRSSRIGLNFPAPSFDQPLFKRGHFIQGDFDVALSTIAVGLGGLFWVLLLRRRLSIEALTIGAWGVGLLQGIRTFLKRGSTSGNGE